MFNSAKIVAGVNMFCLYIVVILLGVRKTDVACNTHI